ncbi:MAG: hypothetical protein COB46_05895 [Rhodospirillaceae bacterium]|nr:MAG: hypothetical protein COB46_05895 [Rhodospirillaceae bacterium]
MIIQTFGITDTGLRRNENEDSILVNDTENLFLVADGVGGNGAGNVASAIAVDVIEEHIEDTDSSFDQSLERSEDKFSVDQAHVVLEQALIEANSRIKTVNNNSINSGQGMATTIVGALYVLKAATLVFAHVGDSRVYRYRKGVLVPLTKDHSAHQVWLDGGSIGEAPKKNIITYALGLRDSIPVFVDRDSSQGGDTYVLCSDGLHDFVSDEEICQALTKNKAQSVKKACENLIEVSKKHGAPDNVTVIIIRCEDEL